MHSFVFLVFLPEWLLQHITDVGIESLGDFSDMQLDLSAIAAQMSYVRIGVMIMLGSLSPSS